jgi:hypothetical protein
MVWQHWKGHFQVFALKLKAVFTLAERRRETVGDGTGGVGGSLDEATVSMVRQFRVCAAQGARVSTAAVAF